MDLPSSSSSSQTNNVQCRHNPPTPRNITCKIRDRELRLQPGGDFVKQNYINHEMLKRFGLERELKGHSGCVNCLDWSAEGSLLLTGSDDTHAILWDPFTYKQVSVVHTNHTDNIFAVQFMPKKNNRIVATGAGDSNVFVHEVEADKKIHGFSCLKRVKQLVTTSECPHNIWSASEDGIVREFDLREPRKSCTRPLVDLTSFCGPDISCKALAINPVRPYLLAVGANDPFVRLYDRRMINNSVTMSPTGGKRSFGSEEPSSSNHVSYFAPGHLHIKHNAHVQRMRYISTTGVCFNRAGSELLVNIGAEQVYLFELDSNDHTVFQSMPINNNRCEPRTTDKKMMRPTSFVPLISSRTTSDSSLSHKAEQLKKKANQLFSSKNYIQSIWSYNAAIELAPDSSVLHGNRAIAYLKRHWDGDVYAALRDCHTALALNPDHAKAHFRMAKCLHELGFHREAQACLAEFTSIYNDYKNKDTCLFLEREIRESLLKPSPSAQQRLLSATAYEVPESEEDRRYRSLDYQQRYCGHCNTLTDIKEASFLDPDGRYVVAGSDDGCFFVWERRTGNLVRVIRADSSVVNCLQPHPEVCLLATSGIDSHVKLWSPRAKSAGDVDDDEAQTNRIATANQIRMSRDPFEALLQSVGVVEGGGTSDEGVNCATS